MKPELARRMASSASGPGVERAPDSPPTSATTNAYLFGAICPARGVGAALALSYADTDMMQLHLDEISRNVAEGARAVLLLDRAGWHTTGKLDVPKNITPIFLPSRASELNPVVEGSNPFARSKISQRFQADKNGPSGPFLLPRPWR